MSQDYLLLTFESHCRMSFVPLDHMPRFQPENRAPVTQEAVIDLEDNKSIDMEDEEAEDAEIAMIDIGSVCVAAAKVDAGGV